MIHKGNNILFNLLGLDNTFTFLLIDGLGRLVQLPQRVHAGNSTAHQSRHPAAIGPLGILLDIGQLDDTQDVQDGQVVDGQVAGVPQLTTDGEVVDDGVGGSLVVKGDRGGLEVLDKLCQTENLSRSAELLLDGFEDVDRGLGVVGARQVPGVEAREVLDGSEDFVTAG